MAHTLLYANSWSQIIQVKPLSEEVFSQNRGENQSQSSWGVVREKRISDFIKLGVTSSIVGGIVSFSSENNFMRIERSWYGVRDDDTWVFRENHFERFSVMRASFKICPLMKNFWPIKSQFYDVMVEFNDVIKFWQSDWIDDSYDLPESSQCWWNDASILRHLSDCF